MTETDDTLRTDLQSKEDTIVALIESGSVPGIKVAKHDGDVAEINPEALVIARISKSCFQHDINHVVECALSFRDRLLDLPREGRGRCVLSFDGWANDHRPLFAIPEIVVFCRALLFGPGFLFVESAYECSVLARPLLEVMFDEKCAWDGDPDPLLPPTYPSILDAAGALWLIGHAFSEDVFCYHEESPTGIGRDIAKNLVIDDNLRRLSLTSDLLSV